MAWYNPLSWGQKDPEKYDPNSPNAQAARTFGGPRHDYDVQGAAAQGTQLNTGPADQTRARQMGLADVINQTIMGGGPSAAGIAAQGQQRAALANAAALNAGARGRSSVGGTIAGNAAASQGVQQAAQNEALGRAQEMAQARGEYGGLLGQVAGQDIGIAGQNAQLGQNANQFNANLRQNAALANQAAQLGISQQEMAARLHQGDMEFTNLDPGSKGYFSDVAGALGSMSPFAHGGVVAPSVPHYADGAVVGSSVPQYQLMGIGQRRVPISQGDLDQGRELAKGILAFLGARKSAQGQAAGEQAGQQAPAPTALPQLGGSGPITSPTQVDPSLAMMFMARGGVVPGPKTALVGEAGPEAIVDIRGVVDRPTVTRLGANGRAQAVIPLSHGRESDRERVLSDIVRLVGGAR